MQGCIIDLTLPSRGLILHIWSELVLPCVFSGILEEFLPQSTLHVKSKCTEKQNVYKSLIISIVNKPIRTIQEIHIDTGNIYISK